MPKNIVICLDGTANEPEGRQTNVARMYDVAPEATGVQVSYYDPGVGTMGSRSAVTRVGKTLTRVGGLALGHGVGTNIEEAYRYLIGTWEPGDRIYIFGFSRGAYTARALAGLLRTVGMLKPSAENLIPYALKLYTSGKKGTEFWDNVTDWNASFGHSQFDRFAKPVHFLGVWDTVKFVGSLNVIGRFRQAKWPFTRNVDAVVHARHAVSIDEKRRTYREYLFDTEDLADANRDLRELWFAGVHSDVGGGFDEGELADIALEWMVAEAAAQGLQVDSARYLHHLGVPFGTALPQGHALGPAHPAKIWWWPLGGWRRRPIPSGADVHLSVQHRIGQLTDGYSPKLDGTQNFTA